VRVHVLACVLVRVCVCVYVTYTACVYQQCAQDNWPTVEPYFNETGSNCPSTLPGTQQQELCELAVRSVQVGCVRLGLSIVIFFVQAGCAQCAGGV